MQFLGLGRLTVDLAQEVEPFDMAVTLRTAGDPFAGARMLRDMLRLDGIDVGRKHVG